MDIVDRFINYTKINTTTNAENGAKGIMPSSPNQLELSKLIKSELEELGLTNIVLRDNAILTAELPSNIDEDIPVVSFFAHLDTSSEQTSDTKAQIVKYDGGDICLNKELNIYLKESEFTELVKYKGDNIICTDGTSLLGADDKAAIASIVNMLKFFKDNPDIEHGTIKVAFVPDEEQGLLGAKALDTKEFGADFGYTLDCCGIGDFVHENWNAAGAIIRFKGQSAHAMNAKGKLKNSLLMAHKFISMLPGGEAPQYTENREGYYWVKNLKGTSASTELRMDLRDFYKESMQKRKEFLTNLADGCNKLWGEGSVTVEISDRYENVENYLKGEGKEFPIELAKQAYKNCDIEMNILPMRGGYDGAVFSQNGIPCPNIFTGAHNFHSIYEYLPENSLRMASNVIIEVVKEARKYFKKGGN